MDYTVSDSFLNKWKKKKDEEEKLTPADYGVSQQKSQVDYSVSDKFIDSWKNGTRYKTDLEEKQEEKRKKAQGLKTLQSYLAPDTSDPMWYAKQSTIPSYVSGSIGEGLNFRNVARTILGVEYLDGEVNPNQLLHAIRTRRDSAKDRDENLKYHSQYDQLLIAAQADLLASTKMDGQNHSVLEEMQLLAKLSGGEKKKRKEAVLKRMKELGVNPDNYALFTDDTNYTWENTTKALGMGLMSGITGFEAGLTNTLDVTVGNLLKGIGWENNPVSQLNNYYQGIAAAQAYDADLWRDRAGGGKAWNFATDTAKAVGGATPHAILAMMTAGASTAASTSSLANQAAYQSGSFLTKAGITTASMAQNPQLWMSFASTLGNDYEEAKKNGANDTVAAIGATITSLLNAGIEIGFDGGSGIQGLADDLAKGNKKKVWAWVESALEEGGEEGLQKFVGEIVTKAMYDHDADILNMGEYGKEMALGTAAGAVLGSGQTAVQSGVNAYNQYQANKLTADEQTVVDKVTQSLIAKEQEKSGKELSNSEKKEIAKTARMLVEKGYVKAEIIERILGGESYEAIRSELQAYKDSDLYKQWQTAKKGEEDLPKLQEEYDKLHAMKRGEMTGEQIDREAALKEQIEAIKNAPKSADLGVQLTPEATRVRDLVEKFRGDMYERVKDSRLAESFKERARSRERFTADPNKYDSESARQTVQGVLDSKLGNGTNEFADKVDFLARLSARTGHVYKLVTEEQLREAGHWQEGFVTHGLMEDSTGDVLLNYNSERNLYWTIGHETGHVVEQSGSAKALQEALFNHAIAKEGLDNFNARLKAKEEDYKGRQDTTPEQELANDLLGEYIFTDYDFVKNLANSDRNVFQKIWDEIKYYYKLATAGSQQQRELEKAMHYFQKALDETGKEQKNTATSGAEGAGVSDSNKTMSREEYDMWRIEELNRLNPQLGGAIKGEIVDSDFLSGEYTDNGTHLVGAHNGSTIRRTKNAKSGTFTHEILHAIDMLSGYNVRGYVEDLASGKGFDSYDSLIDYLKTAREQGKIDGRMTDAEEISQMVLNAFYADREGLRKAAPEFTGFLEEMGLDKYSHIAKSYDKYMAETGESKFSISRTKNMSLKDQLSEYYKRKFKQSDSFYFGDTPTNLERSGLDAHPLAFSQDDFKKSTHDKHDIPRRVLKNLSERLENPIFSFTAGKQAAIVIDDIDGKGKPVVVAIHGGHTMDRNPVNLIKSIYGIDSVNEWVSKQIGGGSKFRVYDIEKANAMLQTQGYLAAVGASDGSWDTITEIAPTVKGKFSISKDNRGKTLYTGSSVTDITQFKVGGKDGTKQTGDRYGQGIYLTTNENVAKGYAGDTGRVYEVNADDLNIFNLNDPVTEDMKATLVELLNGQDKQFRNSILRSFRTEKEFADFDSAERFFNEQRKVWKAEDGYYSANKPEIKSADNKTGRAVIEYTDFSNIDNAIGSMTGNDLYDALKSISTDDFSSFITGHGFDGIAFDEDSENQQYVIYRNEDRLHIENNGSKAKFSLSKVVEETKDLVALHNLTAEKLLKSLELGGLPMPSIAITKAEIPHENFGDITLILGKDSIDPKANKKNVVYSADAWTPVFPNVEYETDSKVEKQINNKLLELATKVEDVFKHDIDALRYSHEDNLNRNGGEEGYIQYVMGKYGLKAAYLEDKGIHIDKITEQVEEAKKFNPANADKYEKVMDVLGVETASEIGKVNLKEAIEQHGEELENAYPGITQSPMRLSRFFGIIQAYIENKDSGPVYRTVTDESAMRKAIDDALDAEGYEAWVRNLFSGIVGDSGIYNNKDIFTPSGNRRSFKQTHLPFTLENIVKAMASQNRGNTKNVAGFNGIKSLRAGTAERFKSIEAMHERKGRLQHLTKEEADKINGDLQSRLFSIIETIDNETNNLGERNSFIRFDSIGEILMEISEGGKYNVADIQSVFAKYHRNISDDIAADIKQLLFDVTQMPVNIYEAKPERAVSFDEVGVFVIPRNADIKLKQNLLNGGYSIAEYDPDVEGDRQKVVNQFEEYKFSLSKMGEGVPAENRVLNDRWSDFDRADPLAEIAPVRKDIAPKTSPIPKVDVAPAPVTDAELFPDNIPSVGEELSNLLQQKEVLEDQMQEAISTQDMDAWTKVSAEYDSLMARIEELEADEADRFDSIEDTDAPPEMDIAPFARADVVPLTKKAAQDIARDVRQKLALSNKQMYDVHMLIEEYSKSEFPDREQLFRDIKEKFGTYTESKYDETVKEAKSYLRTYGLFVSDSIKKEIADFAHLMKKNRGRIRFSKQGTDVDVLYHEMNELFPHLFPESIIAPTDQFMQMVEVANMDVESVVEQQLPDEAIWDVANALADSVADYQQTQREKAANKHGREAFNSLMQDADKYVPPVKINMIPNRRNPMGTENPDAPVAEIYDTQHKKGVVEGQQAMWNDPVPESPGARRKIKMEEHTEKWKNLIGDTSTWKDMALGLSYKTRTLRRILRKVVRGVDGKPDIGLADQIYDELETKYDHNEALLKRESARVKAVFEKLNLNHHEDTYAHMLGELRHNPETTLTQDVVDEFYKKHNKHIDTKKVDTAISEARKTFDDLLVRVNTVLREQGFKEIPYRQGYFPHFTNPKQGWLAKLLNWKTIDTEVPTSIAGLTEQFKPQRSWQSFNKERKGDTTDYSLYQGLDTYIHGALDWIYHIDDLQSRRSLENYLRYIHSEEGVKARIDEIKANNDYDADEAQKLIDAILAEADNPLSGLVRELMNRTNTLANKKAAGDRKMEDDTNRKVYSVMTNLNNRINANMVVGSISSALTNFIPMVQSWHQVSPYFTVRGLGDYLRSVVRDDGMMERSDYLTNRLMDEEKLYQTGWDKVTDKAAWMMNIADRITTNTVWRSKYLQNIKEGMSEAQAIKDADQFAKNVMAGRSRGNAPTIFDEKNPRTKLFTAFQLEVANQYGYMFEDVPKDSKNMARLVKGYATALVGAYVYNALYSSLVGRDVAFDPIKIIEELFKDLSGDDDDEEDGDVGEAFLNLGENIIQQVPFVGGLLGGGRIPVSSAIPYSGEGSPIEGIKSLASDVKDGLNDGNWKPVVKEALKPLYYLAMPVAGGQIKKTVEGLSMFDDDLPVTGSYTDSGKLRFPVEDTLPNRVQAGLFGQYASDNARYYFDNDIAPLGAKQIQEYKDVVIPIRDYWDYRKGLSGLTKAQEKADYINGLDLPTSKKNILINNQLDRKEPVDMTDYDDFGSLEEFDFANKNPEKYDFLTSIGVSYKDYKNANEEEKDVYNWAYEYPDKYALSKVVTKDLFEYKKYTNDLGDIRADKDAYGKSISGSAKEKKKKYIFSLDIDMGAKFIMYKDAYPSVDDYNDEIVEYLNSRDDLTYDDRIAILKELGFTVRNGRVYYD